MTCLWVTFHSCLCPIFTPTERLLATQRKYDMFKKYDISSLRRINTLRGKNGLHAFGKNSAESEPIWMKSGTV